jgi:putative FmdB family regulatory protein
MPIFEFVCEKCDHAFECLILASDRKNPLCPACGHQKVKKLMSAGNIRPQGIPTGSGGFALPKCAPSGG